MGNLTFLQSDHLYGLWIDALVRDEADQLVFLSAWGSETDVQRARALFSLPASEKGLRRFTLNWGQGSWSFKTVRVPSPEMYEHFTGRPTQSRFTHLTHFWMAHRLTIAPDKANHMALLLRRPSETASMFEARLWQMVQTVCPIPLHETWSSLLQDFKANNWIQTYTGFGVDACRLTLPEQDVQPLVTAAIRQGRLALPTTH